MPNLAKLLNEKNRIQKEIIRLSGNSKKVEALQKKLQQINQQIENLGG